MDLHPGCVKFEISFNYPSRNICMSLEFGKEIWTEYKFGKIKGNEQETE